MNGGRLDLWDVQLGWFQIVELMVKLNTTQGNSGWWFTKGVSTDGNYQRTVPNNYFEFFAVYSFSLIIIIIIYSLPAIG